MVAILGGNTQAYAASRSGYLGVSQGIVVSVAVWEVDATVIRRLRLVTLFESVQEASDAKPTASACGGKPREWYPTDHQQVLVPQWSSHWKHMAN